MENSIFNIIEEAGAIREKQTYSDEDARKMEKLRLQFTSMLKENDDRTIDALRSTKGETILQMLCAKSLYQFVEVFLNADTRDINTRRANEVTSDTDFDYPLFIYFRAQLWPYRQC